MFYEFFDYFDAAAVIENISYKAIFSKNNNDEINFILLQFIR